MRDSESRSTEDDRRLTALLIHKGGQDHIVAHILRSAGFRIVEALGINEALRCVRNFDPGLVIVGEDLSPLGRADWLPTIRGLTLAPIVVVGSGGQHNLVRALFRGADAYVDPSVTPRVFLARVRAMLRRCAQSL